MSDYCECGILKAKCTHPNCSEAEGLEKGIRILSDVSFKICPACNQKPCQCNDECESCGA